MLYLRYHSAYGHKNYQSCDMLQGTPFHKFSWFLIKVDMWGYKKIKYIISSSAEDPWTPY